MIVGLSVVLALVILLTLLGALLRHRRTAHGCAVTEHQAAENCRPLASVTVLHGDRRHQ